MTKLFRVILPVSDIDRAARFYANMLGMPGERVSGGRHYFNCGGTILACYDHVAEGDRAPGPPNPGYLYFAVKDLDATFARATTAGFTELDEAPRKMSWGERIFYGRDPFANPIAFVDEATAFTTRRRAVRG